MKIVLIILIILIIQSSDSETDHNTMYPPDEPVRVAVAGLSHDHVHWVFGREDRGEMELTGIYESNRELWDRYSEMYGLNEDLYYTSLEEMLDETEPHGIMAFGSIYDHLKIVEASAPRGVHVMVEKPLAVNLDHALRMAELARNHGIHLLTNYETTWYGSNHFAFDKVNREKKFGDIRKMVVHDGHQGPYEIGVSSEFLEWLTDPNLNGGGAIMDFGCYGANLMTWMMKGEEPVSVTAVTQQFKPDIYPEVDDEATIIVTYPDAQGIIQASWNWPYNRKDMHIYGEYGFIYADDDRNVRIMENGAAPVTVEAEILRAPVDNPFSYFTAVIGGGLEVKEGDLSSLENNLTVMRILDAALRSADEGKTVYLND